MNPGTKDPILRPRTALGTWIAVGVIGAGSIGGPAYMGTRVAVLETKMESLIDVVKDVKRDLREAMDIPEEQKRMEETVKRMVKPEALR